MEGVGSVVGRIYLFGYIYIYIYIQSIFEQVTALVLCILHLIKTKDRSSMLLTKAVKGYVRH